MSDKTHYGIGLLGFGFIGKAHAYSHVTMPYLYEDLPFRGRLVGVCTGHEHTARKAKEEYGFEFCTTRAEQIIESDEIDVVHICTPNALHRDELLAAMEAGKHIYCDKPLVPTWEEAQQILEALEDYDRTHQMTLQYRFYPATMRAKQLVEEGFLGDPACFRASYLHSGSIDPDKPLGWKLDAAMGGGVLNDLATHVVDLLQHLIGPFDSVMASTRILHPERPSRDNPDRMVAVEAEDHACLTLRNDDGLTGTVEATKIATGAQDELRFEIHGTRGAMRFNLMEPDWLEIYEVGAASEPIGGKRGFTRVECVQRYPEPGGKFPASKASIGWIRGHAACLYNFMSALHEGRRPEPGMGVGAELQRFVAAARQSEQQGTFVRPADL